MCQGLYPQADWGSIGLAAMGADLAQLEQLLGSQHPVWVALCHNDLQYGNVMVQSAPCQPGPPPAAAAAAGQEAPAAAAAQLHRLRLGSQAADADAPAPRSPSLAEEHFDRWGRRTLLGGVVGMGWGALLWR
jgi:hypothetical protein